MSYAVEQKAILSHLAANWTTTPVAYPNAAYKPVTGAAWLEARVIRQDAFNVDLVPNRRVRHPGLVSLTLHVPANQGDGAALEMADTLAAVFRNRNVSGCLFRAPTVRPVGTDGAWYRVQVDAPYWRDSVLPLTG